ncbi:MAG: hypothetical protein HZY75_07635 [Nocardioidaceae bacterium]|nr:MAG: hypothetical protein HZY75_07635 [Nocardioidaceae bacterium]
MLARTLVDHLLSWPVASQQVARRNALLAATALTQGRMERDEVDRFVAAAAARREVRVLRDAQLA